MKVSLATSLHLDHSAMTMDHLPGDPIPLQSFVPMGLLCLKAYCETAGIPADIRVNEVNGLINSGSIPNDEEFLARVASAITAKDDQMVGLMTDADSLHHTVNTAREIKRMAPDTLVCLGGPGSSPIAADMLARFDWIDYVVKGEGEETFAELLDALAAGRMPLDVPGLAWRTPTGQIVDNPRRPVMRHLDELPVPGFTAVGVDASSALYLDVGRGCPFSCHFCATAPFWDRRYRMKSIDRIHREMTLIRESSGRNHLSFSHDIFTCHRAWTRDFCQRLIQDSPEVTWSCSTRTDTIDEGLLELMAAAGCAEIYYGIETGSADMQGSIHKNLNIDRSREIVAATAAVGIRPVTGFIIGYPNETPASVAETLDRFFQFLEVGGHRAHLFTLCPFPDAPMYRDGHQLDRRAAYFEPPLVLPELSRGIDLADEHPDIFSSLRRFATPQLNSSLVDASEEISSRLVVLKSIWPRLLPHYTTALDWYQRWVAWIAIRNMSRRPGARLPYTGEVEDLLDFVDEELIRLGLAGTDMSVLVKYERAKEDARTLGQGPSSVIETDTPITPDAAGLVGRRNDIRLVRLEGDLEAALTGRRRHQTVTWVVFARRNGRDLDALQIGAEHARLLTQLATPRSVRDLFPSPDSKPDSTDLNEEPDSGSSRPASGALLTVLRQLAEAGLIGMMPDGTSVPLSAVNSADGASPRA